MWYRLKFLECRPARNDRLIFRDDERDHHVPRMSFRPQVPRVAFSAAVAAKEDERGKAGLFEGGIALDGGVEALEDYPGLAKVTFAAVDVPHHRSIVVGQLDS